MYAYQRLKAPNDLSGNPRRLIVVYDLRTGDAVRVIDEGYGGSGRQRLIAEGVAASVELPAVNIGPSEYNAWLRGSRKNGTADR